METKDLDYLKKAASSYKSKILPVIDQTIACKNGYTTTGNLEESIRFKAHLWDEGVYNILGQIYCPIDQYPDQELAIKKEKLLPVTYIPSTFPLLDCTAFAAVKDEIRPVVQCVYFDRENMVATDAHVLRAVKHNLRVHTPFLIPVRFIKELAGLIKHFREGVEVFTDDTYLIFENKHIKATLRTVEETFPNYQAVMPHPCDNGIKVTFPIKEIVLLYRDAKKAGITTNAGFDLENKKAFVFEVKELSCLAEFPLTVESKNLQDYTTLIMPMHSEDNAMPRVSIHYLNICKTDHLYLHTETPLTRAFIC